VEQSNFTLLDKKQLKSTSACGDIWRNYHKGLLYLYIILVVSVFLELAYREIPKNGMAQNRPIPHITVPRSLVKHCVNTPPHRNHMQMFPIATSSVFPTSFKSFYTLLSFVLPKRCDFTLTKSSNQHANPSLGL
jgi:hypothetical protein